MRSFLAALILLCGSLLGQVAAQSAADETGRVTGYPIPRFVSLRADEVNLRAGPGLRYPILWIYRRATLPVEVVEEFETWRRVRDSEGSEGWVHKTMIDGKRYVKVVGEIAIMRRDADAGSVPVAQLEPGVLARLDECEAGWCAVSVEGLSGWLPATGLYGLLAKDLE